MSGRAPISFSAIATARVACRHGRDDRAALRGFGYSVSRNKPYAGGFITEHYGNPTAGLHAIQLEINRALYMDERRYERTAAFDGSPPSSRCWRTAGRNPARGTAALSGGRGIALQRKAPGRIRSLRRNDPRRKKKGRSHCGSGPSLGRKRPRRATVTRENLSLPHCNNIHRVAQKARAVDLIPAFSPKTPAICAEQLFHSHRPPRVRISKIIDNSNVSWPHRELCCKCVKSRQRLVTIASGRRLKSI